MSIKILASLAALFFFILAFLTLKDYGISWDETLHFQNGQAFLHYFLTGREDYQDSPVVNLQGSNGNPAQVPAPRRSFYQSDNHDFNFWLKTKPGHPVINDELAALSNYIFYQKLGILDDISAYHLFNILAASFLVFAVVYFSLATFGNLSAILSLLSLLTYPLFWSESHFNIKDPPETAFFAMSILAFYQLSKKFTWQWLTIFWIFFTLALGTKFNVFFILFIIGPYFFYKYKFGTLRSWLKLSKKNLFLVILGLFLSVVAFLISWPTLWHNLPFSVISVFEYYKQVGTGFRYQPDNFFLLGFNFYPPLWILVTTPPIVLILSGVGIVSAFINRREYQGVSILWLLWLLVPILRVMVPGTDIYGGSRQIMEFLPALCLLAGLGGWQIFQFMKTKLNRQLLAVCLVLFFIWPVVVLVKLHPNENVYFNSLIGGLAGASSKSFPAWGNSFGNVYLQGIDWINKNAPPNSKLALIQGTPANAPAIFLRRDIDYRNSNWSGIKRGGEYLMELTFNDTTKTPKYGWEYVDDFLKPVYQVRVDGVPILKIWKNDLEHTQLGYRLTESEYKGKVDLSLGANNITITLAEEEDLSRFRLDDKCLNIVNGYIETSLDGNVWTQEQDQIPTAQVGNTNNLGTGYLEYWFAGRKAKYIRLVSNQMTNCQLNDLTVKVYILQ